MIDKFMENMSKLTLLLIVISTVTFLVAKGFTLITIGNVIKAFNNDK